MTNGIHRNKQLPTPWISHQMLNKNVEQSWDGKGIPLPDFDSHKVNLAANGMKRHFGKDDGVSRKPWIYVYIYKWNYICTISRFFICLALLTNVQVNLMVSGRAFTLFLPNQACLNSSSDPGNSKTNGLPQLQTQTLVPKGFVCPLWAPQQQLRIDVS